MNEENKELKDDKWETDFNTTMWFLIMFMVCFGWNTSNDYKDHELRERVARLEGQMDMIRR